MKYMGLNEVREEFLAFFEGKDHLRMASAPLVPQNDKSLLLINSGMAPLKAYFTGQETPPRKRVTTCQKCIRTGDIENVGKTARHGTFFEMLGNFSFGDYFKEEAIAWAWEFVTEVLDMPKDRLYASIYQDDDEAFEIWQKYFSDERIVRLGKEDNFWEVGLGPCGPCSELYYDRGEKFGCGDEKCFVGCECDRYVEFWNLVFTQFDKQEDGSYPRLEFPNIDTGMGLERIAAIMQNADSIFDVDTVKAVREKICGLAGAEYGADPAKDVSIRLITDHVRSITFMTADGVLPSNEGRGYVLRRLLRRALRHAKLLGINDKFINTVVRIVIEHSGGAYPELEARQDHIYKALSMEESRFFETLEAGMEMLREHIGRLASAKESVLGGKDAFRMYDTFGFPLELMTEILAEADISVNEDEFFTEMEKQRERARAAREDSSFMGTDATVYDHMDAGITGEFAGYDVYETDARVLAIVVGNELRDEAAAGEEVSIIVDSTPFYAASGGQTGDSGWIKTPGGQAEISDCVKAGSRILHLGVVKEGRIQLSEPVSLAVDKRRRLSAARNHTATHLLHKSLREILGGHVEQAGSYVSPERLRFDFTHFGALTSDELLAVEDLVNEKIFDALDVDISEKSMDEARKQGAMALFGEKYGDKVRVVDIDGYCVELCGGTHIGNTAQAGSFKILSETGVAAGVRRIEAFTGRKALEYYRDGEERINLFAQMMKTAPADLTQKLKAFLEQNQEMKREIERMKSGARQGMLDHAVEGKEMIGAVAFIHFGTDEASPEDMRSIADRIKDKLGSGVVFLTSVHDDKVSLLAAVTDDCVAKGINAGTLVREAVAVLGGRGGGRPNMAQAGGVGADKIPALVEKVRETLREV
ncbi:MAG: alanine--tRNA ligase [Defluviitaleaceae bacterium]|nr:alanine--tRNA ligase [Defluviitaleaceae bacterium]